MASSSKRFSSKKRRKRETNKDRISNLPEPILCHILSFLPTKDQIKTTLLSKTFLSLWTSVSDLDFIENLKTNQDRFSKFVNTVFLRLRNYSIRKFRLQCYSYNRFLSININAWISTAIARNVQELELYQSLGGGQNQLIQLVSCKTILVLKLGGSVLINVGDSNVQFPSLKTLHLEWVDSIPSLLSGCPVLEELVLRNCVGDDIRVCVPTLRRLGVNFHVTCNFVADCPALEYLSFHGCSSHEPMIQIEKLLTTLPYIKSVSIACLELQRKSLRGLFDGFPMLNNLVSLEIDIYMSFEWLQLMESCHNLENIFIREKMFSNQSRTPWRQPRVVPKCLSTRLKTFRYQGFLGGKDEMSFAKYVLENAMVLKKMVIMTSSHHLTLEKRSSVVSKLSAVSVGSKACQPIFK